MGIEGTVTAPDATLEVVRVPMFDTNYGWILRDVASGIVAAVDPAEPLPIQEALVARDWKLGYILNTHHHQDHVGGNSYLKDTYGCKIYGPAADKARIPLIDETFADGDRFKLGATEFKVFDTPGHTRGHITFWAPDAKALFPGDTLFAMGCGRLFEGTPEQMWTSLSKLKTLPAETQVFCAHEYTENNAKWAVTVDPTNIDLKQRADQVMQQRKHGEATIPTTIAIELATNPFLRPGDTAIRSALSVSDAASDVEAFAAIRGSKDKWAVGVEPDNALLQTRAAEVKKMRSRSEATIPTTIQLEIDTNPFLRTDSSNIRSTLQLPNGASDADVVAALRKHKEAASGIIGWLIMGLYPVADYFGYA